MVKTCQTFQPTNIIRKKKQQEINNTKRLSRIEKWKKTQNTIQRSRLSRYQKVTLTDAQIKEHKQNVNTQRVQRSRARVGDSEDQDEVALQRKTPILRWSKAKETYENEIRELYCHICNACGKMCKKNQVQQIKKSTLKEKGFSSHFIKKIFCIENYECEEFCRTCVTYIKKGNVPKLCLQNGLHFPPIDDEISQLNRIEERLLAP
ncbi:tRNA dimethylallyltransferase [Frankliniella fusca]|uniref:tRNA dimethylallyltransferase n=1 Tax=Frankliniella fusca TaxID=407009 RepID=A0AAE1LFT6_9NEOP|nr:tRNA dimethylallyltransferase [Frankliniella fusca]